MDTRLKALTGLDLDGKTILEIGPLNRPTVKPAPNVYYADHCSTEGLREKYAHDPAVNTDEIVDVHFDLSATTIENCAETVGGFDVVVASHVIEHVPNLIGWLRSIHSALRDGGTLALVVPDRNYTFDFFRRETEYWMIEEAERENRTRPSLRQVMEHFINIVDANAHELWQSKTAHKSLRPAISVEAAIDLRARYDAGEYIDVHCWVFDPRNFHHLLSEAFVNFGFAYEIWLSPTPPGQLEFYAQLRKVA